MPLAVGNVGYQVEGTSFGIAEETVNGFDKKLDDVNVSPFVKAADVVGVGYCTTVENEVDGTGVVFNVKPVANVFALAVHGKGLAMANVVDEKRYELFGELVRTVVV